MTRMHHDGACEINAVHGAVLDRTNVCMHLSAQCPSVLCCPDTQVWLALAR